LTDVSLIFIRLSYDELKAKMKEQEKIWKDGLAKEQEQKNKRERSV
jgi:hypothetical protein